MPMIGRGFLSELVVSLTGWKEEQSVQADLDSEGSKFDLLLSTIMK